MIKLDYGSEGLEWVPKAGWNYTIFTPKPQEIIKRPIEAIKNAIKKPIGTKPFKQILKEKEMLEKICIVVSDSTRPAPSRIMLKALLDELVEHGINKEKITILIATGLHRVSRKEELNRILGENISKDFRIINHIATDTESLNYLGKIANGIPIYINKHYI